MIGKLAENGSRTLMQVNSAPHASSTRRTPNRLPRYTERGPMNIIAALNAVPSQDALSGPRCKAPRKSVRPTLSNCPAHFEIIAPNSTPKTPKIGWVVTAEATVADAVGVDCDEDAERVLKIESPAHSHSCPKTSQRHGSSPLWTSLVATCLAVDVQVPVQSSPVFAVLPWCNFRWRCREAAEQIANRWQAKSLPPSRAARLLERRQSLCRLYLLFECS